VPWSREILMDIRTRVLFAGAAAAVVAGASGVAVASSASSTASGGKPSTAASSAPSRTLFDSKAVAVMAAQLGISTDQARNGLDQIQRLAAKGSIDPADPAFVAIARSVGVTPKRLASALDQVKIAAA
jgi:hypothetical protein